MPPDTFSHSTTTVPLKSAAAAGRRTNSRVMNGAHSAGSAAICPFRGSSPTARYDWA